MAQSEAYQTSISVDVNGMDAIFHPPDTETTSTGYRTDATTTKVDTIEESTDNNEFVYLTVTEAARVLGVPYTTFYRHVKAGKYKTTNGEDGKPRVELAKSAISAADTGSDNAQTEVVFAEHDPDTYEPEADTSGYLQIIREQRQEILDSRRELAEAQRRLEAANYRLGYLESQVEQQTEHIKLLTADKPAPSPKWWQRLFDWSGGDA